jgi:hypothetical protein
MIVGQRWETSGGGFGFLIQQEAWCRIEYECDRAQDHETGGILIGFYSDDKLTAVVTEATGPPLDSRLGGSWFWRGIGGLKDLLSRRWGSKRRTYYIGEWHYHPALHLEPSEIDITQMCYISQDLNYHCSKPIMIIVGKNHGGSRAIRAFLFPQREDYLEFHISLNRPLERVVDHDR